MAKDKLIEAYRSMESRLHWFERLEQLRAHDCAPFAAETIALGEYDKDSPGESLSAEVYAPFSVCGGVIRIIWRSANGRDSYVIVKGYEDYISECLRRDDSRFKSIGERLLAERLNIQVNERRPRPAA
jgi:hypothetical protein